MHLSETTDKVQCNVLKVVFFSFKFQYNVFNFIKVHEIYRLCLVQLSFEFFSDYFFLFSVIIYFLTWNKLEHKYIEFEILD